MNAITQSEYQALELVDVVDFKWLMAHEGHHIQVERLENDRDYACDCFARAQTSPVDALRRTARRLALQLGCAKAA
jgi:hypothetical protein